jgi:hypothetical protein
MPAGWRALCRIAFSTPRVPPPWLHPAALGYPSNKFPQRLRRPRDSLSDFNDGCKDFAELRALIVEARATAMNDADPEPAPRPRLDIEHDELVMA